MKSKKTFLKLKLFFTVVFIFLIVTVISSCACPLFSLFERFTGIEIKTGRDIEQSLIVDELVYPDSRALLQAEGDITGIMELAGRYGVNLSEKELEALNELPQEIREQEISATIYSTADDKTEVLDYYDSFSNKEWDILKMQNEEQTGNEGRPVMLLASDEDQQQAFMLIGTENNTFIIFVDFDWEKLSEMGK